MSEKKHRRKTVSVFPKNSLLDALRIAQSIEKNNAGEPYNRLDLAQSLEYSPNSSTFRTLIISSGRYGLTEGGYTAPKIALMPLGKSIVAPTSDEEKNASLRTALLNVETYAKFFAKFDGKQLPRKDLLLNTLERELGIPRKDCEACYNMIMKNAQELGVIQNIKGSDYIHLDKLSAVTRELPEEKGKELLEVPPPPPKPEELVPKYIFIAHGKNKRPLEQLKKILDQFHVPYKVAIEEPHKGRPISEKVGETMKSCNSAIFIFTADEEVLSSDGSKTYRPSDNVVYELGAATVLYGKRIVIFKEEEVTFASDFSDFGYITFEKDSLDAKTMELLRELVAFGLLKVTPA